MEYTTLGKTGLKVSVAGLGCGGFSRLGIPAGKTEDEAAPAHPRGRRMGINLLDTAPAYGTEAVVGKALKSIPRPSVVVATKAFVYRNNAWHTPERVVASLDNSLRLMGTDYVDVFQLHGIMPRRIRLLAGDARARAARAEGQGQDPAHRHHRAAGRGLHPRDAGSRDAGRHLGGLHGRVPHDAPERTQGAVPARRGKSGSARC